MNASIKLVLLAVHGGVNHNDSDYESSNDIDDYGHGSDDGFNDDDMWLWIMMMT